MRKRIQDLAYARFQYEKPEPRFSTERLEFEVLQEEVYRGSFSLTSVNGIPMRGIVYSSNPRMECLTPEFEGEKVDIRFEFHSEGLVEGDTQKGDFTIICNGGEYDLSFVASVTRFYARTSIGKIKNLFDFANLAQVSFDEAFHIFTAPFFENIIKQTEIKERLLYRAVGAERANRQGMEEFLIGIRKKQRVSFAIEEHHKQLSDVTEDSKEVIRIKKEQWGYLEISVSSDHPALVPVKSRITTADFIGNYVEAEFIIQAGELHAGNNFGRLIFTSLNHTEVCEVCICSGGASEKSGTDGQGNPEARKKNREKKKLLERLTRLYLDFRMQRIVTGVWSRESCICLTRLKELEPENQWYTLYQAQALLINKQRQEAEWILDAFKRELKEKDTPLYAYFLYICTLQEGEKSYVTKIFRQIQEIYHRNQDNIAMFLIMLFLDPELNQSKSRKLSAIEEKIGEGMHSPVLYMEAYYLIRHDVYLLQRADMVELQILNWAARQQALTVEVASQINRNMAMVRQFHPLWYEILKACYQVDPCQEILQTICSFGIKWNRFSGEMFEWYDKGIREELRIAGLYEAWISCAQTARMEQFPKNVMLYFQYQSNLNDRMQAWLYASIVKNKWNQKSLYTTYQKNIEHFAVEQLQAGRIDENLAVLYEDILPNLPLNEERAAGLSKILYTNKLVCEDKHAVRIVVVHHELKKEQAVPLVNHQAYIQLYSNSYCILAEDEKGIRYMPAGSWELQRLMKPEQYVEKCMQFLDREIPFLIHYFEGRKTFHTFQKEDLPRLMQLLDSDEISKEYKAEIKPQMIEYYYNSFTGEELDEYLSHVDYQGLQRNVRNKLMELMIARGIYDRAYEMLMAFGSEQAAISKLLLVAGQKIQEMDYGADSVLIGLCDTIFERGKFNESILRYLCRYYKGNVREMEHLWKAAKDFEIDTYELEERFLVQLLYTESYTEEMEHIFQSYFDANGQEMVIMAYLSYFSYQYFVKQVVMSDALFLCIQQQILLENPLNDSCRLAYFRWLTGQNIRTKVQEKLLEELLREYLKRHMYFAFYQELPQKLLRKYYLHDRIFLEYRTNPAYRVIIDYCYNQPGEENSYTEEVMDQMYEGIFVKQFVVFFGEEIPYYIKEEDARKMTVTESGHIRIHDLMTQGDESCYDLINGMMISYHLKDEQTLRQLYAQYQAKQQLVEETFRLV